MHTDDGLTPQVGIAELIAGSDTLVHDLVTPPAPAQEVCPLCHSWKAESLGICDSCEVTGRAVKFPIGPISVITLTSKPSALRDWLTRYKGRPGDDDPFEQESYQRVRAITGRYLLEHGRSLVSNACGVDTVVVVPSAGTRPIPHPLEQILSELSLAAPIERLLTRGPGALDFRVSAADGYLCDVADQQRRVLLIEDVFVTGARIFSAAHALQSSGHIVAGTLVLARRVNRDWGGSQAMWDSQVAAGFSWRTSPRTAKTDTELLRNLRS